MTIAELIYTMDRIRHLESIKYYQKLEWTEDDQVELTKLKATELKEITHAED